jgi:hypothetical protein
MQLDMNRRQSLQYAATIASWDNYRQDRYLRREMGPTVSGVQMDKSPQVAARNEVASESFGSRKRSAEIGKTPARFSAVSRENRTETMAGTT